MWNCGDTQCEDSGNGNNSRQYDAENHLVGQSYTNWQTYTGSVTCPSDWTGGSGKGYVAVTVGLSYKWGANGHIVEAGNNSSGTMQYETLHWDANRVLFTTTSGGTVDDLKLDGDADITLSGGSASANFTQRDFSGATGNPPNASRQLCSTTTTPYIWQPGPDGITDGYNVFQGVRNYDPAVGTWATPDAYQGEVSDPMSQHAYMWNRNNSFSYADPSGYVTIELWDDHFGGGVGHAAIFIPSGKGDSGTLLCNCGSKGSNPASGPIRMIIEKTNLRSLTRGVGKGNAARYDNGTVFNTTASQENKIKSMFSGDANSHYNVLDHNCVQSCSTALHAAGQLLSPVGDSMIPRVDEKEEGSKPLTQIDKQLQSGSGPGYH